MLSQRRTRTGEGARENEFLLEPGLKYASVQ
jgi:hypothetical protein